MWHNASVRTNIYLVHLCKFHRSLHTSQRGSSADSSEIPVFSPLSSLYFLSSSSWAACLLFLSSRLCTEVFLSFKRPLCLITYPQDFLHVLVHHVGDANCWNDFEEVGSDAAIQARYTFVRYDVFELAHHGQLGFSLSNGWKKRKVKEFPLRSTFSAHYLQNMSKCTVLPTLCLHTCPNECKGIGGQLAAGAGDGTASQQNQDARVCGIDTEPLEPGILQSLTAWAEDDKEEELTRKQILIRQKKWEKTMDDLIWKYSGIQIHLKTIFQQVIR